MEVGLSRTLEAGAWHLPKSGVDTQETSRSPFVAALPSPPGQKNQAESKPWDKLQMLGTFSALSPGAESEMLALKASLHEGSAPWCYRNKHGRKLGLNIN